MALFSQKPKAEVMAPVPGFGDEVGNIGRKVRLIEDRYAHLQKKAMLSEQNQMSSGKRMHNEIKAINVEILELRHLIDTLENKLLIIIKELKSCAKREEVELVKKYVNLWEPIRFVTRKEVETIVQDVLEDTQQPANPR